MKTVEKLESPFPHPPPTSDQSSNNDWLIDLWGKPDDNQFFGTSFDVTSDAYIQWNEYVDVAAFIPVVYNGSPTAYGTNGQPSLGSDIAYADDNPDRLAGAQCNRNVTGA